MQPPKARDVPVEGRREGDRKAHLPRPRGFGWFATFAVLVVLASVIVYYTTGQDALGAAARFAWNAIAVAINGLFELLGSFLGVLARGIGWSRLSRIATVVGGIGLGYAGSVILSEEGVHRAVGWRAKLGAAAAAARDAWLNLHLVGKLLVVVILIASQVYLHSVLILFPIAFLVPVVRRLWVRTADFALGDWYRTTFGEFHRATVAFLRRMPVARHIIGAIRVTRIRYLCAWRTWRYHPRYRTAAKHGRRVSMIEPFVLWRRGELDRYIGAPLLAGERSDSRRG